jgi:hypothetical protein
MKGDGGRCEGRNNSPLLQGKFLPPKAPPQHFQADSSCAEEPQFTWKEEAALQ